MNLLLIDDDKVDRINTIRTLHRSNYSLDIMEASSAEEGLNLAQSNTFDVILLDYQLPSMTGLDLLKVFRNFPTNSTAVVMLSYSDDESLAIDCLEAGAQDFICKSEVTVSRLMRAILHSRERYRIEQELRDSHEQLRYLAEIDTLTGLANRHMFEMGLKKALSRASRHGSHLALLMLDLDNFKNVNDTLGHIAGDDLLKEVAKRLQEMIRDGDLLCRLGGDEFAILVHDLDTSNSVMPLIERILNVMAKPILLEGKEMTISVSIGIASYPESATDPIQLLKSADVAMYRSKEAGKNQAQFYSKTLHEEVYKRVEIERELQHALERNEFILHYQPQIDTKTRKVVGAEALIRWQHPVKGLIPPDDFISIAEDIGAIDAIGAWVMETACAQSHQWRKEYNSTSFIFSIAVNLSAKQLNQRHLVEDIKSMLVRHQIPPECIELELTESTLNKCVETGVMLLRELSEFGIKLSLDDFGTGYSSLLLLQKYPFQVLKIDKSFIHPISDNQSDSSFLKAINAFSKALGMQVVAEGVETESQERLCQELNFDRMQGYYFGRPMSAEMFAKQFLS